MEFVVLLIFSLIFYFIPGIIGNSKRNSGAIWVLNIFLGWTLIGWVIALVWACTTDPPEPRNIIHNVPNPTSKVQEIERLKALFDSGALTREEFDKAKWKILN